MRSKWLWLLLLIPLLLIIGFGGYVVVGSARNAPMDVTALALESGADVTVTTDPWMTFTPTGMPPTAGFVIYPGGLVPAEAYAPTARAIAAQGFLVVLPEMPLNLAVTNSGVASDIIAAFPEIAHWAVGGHSLGGAMAAAYVGSQDADAPALVLWAAYPAEGNDLSQRTLPVLSIYGTSDGVATLADIDAARRLLPPDTLYVAIEGGNHTQFGWYGDGLQAGDNPAGISREEQQAIIADSTAAFLASLGQ